MNKATNPKLETPFVFIKNGEAVTTSRMISIAFGIYGIYHDDIKAIIENLMDAAIEMRNTELSSLFDRYEANSGHYELNHNGFMLVTASFSRAYDLTLNEFYNAFAEVQQQIENATTEPETTRATFETWFAREKCHGMNPLYLTNMRYGANYGNAKEINLAWETWQAATSGAKS